MTVTVQVPLKVYTAAAAATVFAYDFKIFAGADLFVSVDGVQKTLATHYTVSGAGSATGGNVTFLAPMTGGEEVIIDRDVAEERETNYQEGGDLLGATHNDDHDRPIMLIQQVNSRALKIPLGDARGGDMILPSVDDRADKYFGFGPNGEPLMLDPAGGALSNATNVTYTEWIAAAVPYLKTLSDIANGDEVSFFRFITRAWHSAIRARASAQDVTANLQVAVDAAPALRVPYGTYNTSSEVLISADRSNMTGEGKQNTIWNFTPGGAANFLRYKKGSSVLYQCALRNMGFASGDTAYVKRAIRIEDTSEMVVENIAVYPWADVSHASAGLQTMGREHATLRNLSINADRPIQISANPNTAGVLIEDTDHFDFDKCYLLPHTSQSCVTCDSNVAFSNTSFTRQSWVGGLNGFKWNEVAAAGASFQLSFEKIRCEQAASAAGFMFDILATGGLYSLNFANVHGGIDRKGFKLRGVNNADFRAVHYLGSGKTAMDDVFVGESVRVFSNCNWGVNTATMTNSAQQWASQSTTTAACIPDNAVFTYDAGTANPMKITGVKTFKREGKLAAGASVLLKIGTGVGGIVAKVSLVAIDRTANVNLAGDFIVSEDTCDLIGTPLGLVDDANTAGNVCLFDAGTDAELLNNRANEIVYCLTADYTDVT